MGRARDLANILSSSGNVALDSELGISLITPTSIANTGGSASISSTGAVSFTSASAINLNGCFTSTYDNYKIIITTNCNSDTDMGIRMRASGTDNSTTSSYILQRTTGTSTTPQAIRQTNNYFAGFNVLDADTNALDLTLYRPFLTKPTLLTAHMQYGLFSSINNTYAGQHNQSVSYDGFTIYGATFTGTIRVYGYRN
jgi:hypothetical protein